MLRLKKELVSSQEKNVTQAEQGLAESRIAAEEKYQELMNKIAEQGAVKQTQTLQEERDVKLDFLNRYYQAALQLAKQNGEDTNNVETAYQTARQNILKEYADKELAKVKELEERKVQARQEYGLDTLEDQYAARRKKIENDNLLNEQERQQALTNLGKQDGKMFHADYDPDRRGFIDKPTVIVGEGGYGHSKEWVASNAAVENPTVAPFIDIIDRAQRAGTIRTLDMNKFLIQQAQGRASGGYVTPSVNDVRGVTKDSYKDTLIERLTDVLDRLSIEGFPASVSLNEIEQKQQLQDKARRFGSK